MSLKFSRGNPTPSRRHRPHPTFCATVQSFWNILEHTQTSLSSVMLLLSAFSPAPCPSPSASLHILWHPLLKPLSTSLQILPDYATCSGRLLSSCVLRRQGSQEQWVHFHCDPGVSLLQHLNKHRNHSWFFHCCPNLPAYTNEKWFFSICN